MSLRIHMCSFMIGLVWFVWFHLVWCDSTHGQRTCIFIGGVGTQGTHM